MWTKKADIHSVIKPTTYVSVNSKEKVSEPNVNQAIFQSLRICNGELRIKNKNLGNISVSLTSVSITGYHGNTMKMGDVQQLSSTTGSSTTVSTAAQSNRSHVARDM